MMHILSLCVCLSLLMVTGCSTTDTRRTTAARPTNSSIPEWVIHTPEIKKRICAVGVSEPTYFKDDGKRYAAESARVELSHVLNTRIESIMVDIQESNGGFVDRAAVSEVSSWASESVLTGAQILEYWYDEEGVAFARQKSVTYALACMPIDAQASGFAERLKKAFPEESKEVAEKAEKAFEELGKAEEKKR